MSTASAMFSASARAKGMIMGAGGPTSLTPDSPFRRQEAYNYINPGHGQGGKQFFKYGVSRKIKREVARRATSAISETVQQVAGASVRPAVQAAPIAPLAQTSSATAGVFSRARSYLGGLGDRIGGGFNRATNYLGRTVERVGANHGTPLFTRVLNNVSNTAAMMRSNFGAGYRLGRSGDPTSKMMTTKSGALGGVIGRANRVLDNVGNFAGGFSTGVRNRGGTPPPISNKAFVSGYKLGSFGAHKIRPKPINVSTNSSRGFTATPQTPTGAKGSLGVSEFFDTVGSSWNNLSRTQQWAMGGGAAVAGLVALNVGYNSIKNSKQSPFGSAVAGGLLVGGGAMGLRYGGRQLAKWGTGNSASDVSMRAIGAGMEKMGPKSWKGAAKLGAYTAGGVAALGVGRSVIGQ